jgi:hypothetical protein
MTALERLRGLCLLAWLAAACLPGCGKPYLPPQDPALPAEAVALMRSGDAMARQSQWQAAIAQYDQARKASPQSHLPLYGLATAFDRLGGRDFVAIAYYRAYLAALPLGQPEEVGLVLGRVDELDRRAAERVAEIVRQARRMADEIPPDIWWDRSVDREQLLRSLADVAAQPRGDPPPRDSHRDRRGQPSALAALEVSSWIEMAESMRANPSLAEPWTELKAAGSQNPENAVRVVCSVARSQAETLRALRDRERQWQAKWDVACPP